MSKSALIKSDLLSVLQIVFLLLCIQLVSAVVIYIVNAIFSDVLSKQLVMYSSVLLSAAVLIWGIYKYRSKNSLTSKMRFLGLKRVNTSGVCKVILLVIISYFMLHLVYFVFPNSDMPDEQEMYNVLSNPLSFILMLLAVSVAAPIVEEILFRGLLFKRLSNSKYKRTVFIILSSMAFTVMHLQYVAISSFIIVFLLGVLFSMIKLVTRNTTYCIVAHSTHNSIVFVLITFSVLG